MPGEAALVTSRLLVGLFAALEVPRRESKTLEAPKVALQEQKKIILIEKILVQRNKVKAALFCFNGPFGEHHLS